MTRRQARRQRGVGYGATPFRPTSAHTTSTDAIQGETRWGAPPPPGQILRTVAIDTDAAPPYRLKVRRSTPRPSSRNPLVRLRRLSPFFLLRLGRRPAGSIQRRSTIILSGEPPPRPPFVPLRFRTRSDSTWAGPMGTSTPFASKIFSEKESASRTGIAEAETRRGRLVGVTCPWRRTTRPAPMDEPTYLTCAVGPKGSIKSVCRTSPPVFNIFRDLRTSPLAGVFSLRVTACSGSLPSSPRTTGYNGSAIGAGGATTVPTSPVFGIRSGSSTSGMIGNSSTCLPDSGRIATPACHLSPSIGTPLGHSACPRHPFWRITRVWTFRSVPSARGFSKSSPSSGPYRPSWPSFTPSATGFE